MIDVLVHLAHQSDAVMQLLQTPESHNIVAIVNHPHTDAWLPAFFQGNIVAFVGFSSKDDASPVPAQPFGWLHIYMLKLQPLT